MTDFVIPQFRENLNALLTTLETELEGDILCYNGSIRNGIENEILSIIEDLVSDPEKKDKIFIILTTTGGSAFAVERYVNILRAFYNEVNFIIPDYAYSAGTIFCMSGDNIYMDYFSVLGPIDPQVPTKDGKWVAALGYLDTVNEFINKSANEMLTQAEFLRYRELDLAELKEYEQAKNLTISLLKKWLVIYKFKNWNTHSSTDEPVTPEEKQARAEEIAAKLSDNNIWKSHGRPINLNTLRDDLKLKIEDFSQADFRPRLRNYYLTQRDYMRYIGQDIFIHTRKFLLA